VERIDNIRRFVEENFAIVATKKRSQDTLLTLKCPVCGDNKKPNNKNRVRASFKIGPDYIGYWCFNCDKGYPVSNSISTLAFLLSREKDISFAEAKSRVSPLLKDFVGFEEQVKSLSKASKHFNSVKLPGEPVTSKKNIEWLVRRGFNDLKIIRDFREDGDTLYVPFTLNNKIIGYQEIDTKRKRYLNHTGSNDLTSVVIGLDDITPDTQRVMVVESVLDAKMITQDSESIIVGLSVAGLSFNKDRASILTELGLPFIINLDNDKSGIKVAKALAETHPDWLGTFSPAPYKDYGEYRKGIGPMAALSRLVSEAAPIYSSKFHLLRLE